MGEKSRVVYDGDLLVYACGFVGEKRTIKAVHKQSGDEYELDNRTAMYGRKKSKDGGWLAEQNASRETPWTVEDFDIYDIQTPAPLSHSLQAVKTMVEKTLSAVGTNNLTMFHGEGDSFRVEASTVVRYKGNRENSLKPFYKDDIIEFIKKKYKSIACTGLEADDWLIISALEDGGVVASHDKDCRGSAVRVINPTKMGEGILDCRTFGDLWVEEKVSASTGKITRDVKGYGRKFFWHQLNWADPVDNYFANSASDIEWGEMSSFKSLRDCKTDLDCMKSVIETYKYLYPEKKKIIGWRDNEIEVDYKYMINENFTMAHMLRKPDERITAEEVFTKFGLWT